MEGESRTLKNAEGRRQFSEKTHIRRTSRKDRSRRHQNE
jgi:hypothetical protein